MQDDPFPAAERILSDIEIVFKKDPQLREFDILPVTLNQNKSPVHHVEHCLGLESWCVRHVYCYTYRRLMDIRQQRHRRTEPSTLSCLLLGALLLNPDVPTFWNMRRELVQAGRLDITAELHFTAVVLSRKPKSAEAFSHRKWLLRRLLTGSPDASAVLAEELRVSQYAADHYANNYHAWQHRMWCMSQLVPLISDPMGTLSKEWASSEAWVSMHVSDHSGLQYRQFLQAQVCQTTGSTLLESARKALCQYLHQVESGDASRCKDYPTDTGHCPNSSLISSVGLIASELLLNSDLILRYTGHEALWCHRRFLLISLKSILKGVCDASHTAGSRNSEHQTHVENKLLECREKEDYKLTSHHSKISRIENFKTQRDRSQNNNHHEDFPINVQRLHDDDFSNLKENVSIKNDEGKCTRGEQKLCSEGKEICNVLLKAVPLHEEQLLAKSVAEDVNQKNMAARHREWLNHILRLPAPNLGHITE